MFQMTTSDIVTKIYKMVVGLAEGSSTPGNAFNDILDIINMLLQEWEGKEAFPWNIKNTQIQFTAISSVVNITGLETYYTCIKAHTAAAINKPNSGANWRLYWVEAGSSDDSSDWVTATSYTTNMIHTLSELDSLIVGVNSARVLSGGSNYNIDVLSREAFEQNYSDYAEGRIERIWMENVQNQNDVVPVLHMHPNLTDIEEILFLTVLTMPEASETPTAYIPIQQKWLKALIWSACSDYSDVVEVTDRWGAKGFLYLAEAIKASQENIISKVLTGAFEI